MLRPWKMTLMMVIDTPENDAAADDLADAINEELEKIKTLAGQAVAVVKVIDLDTISEEEFDNA